MTDLSPVLPFLHRGAFAEAYLEKSRNVALSWEDGRLESASRSDAGGVGLRYLQNRETRFGHLSLADPLSVPWSVEDVLAMQDLTAQLTEGWPALSPIPPKTPLAKFHPMAQSFESKSLEEKARWLEALARRAEQIGPSIRQVTLQYGEKFKEMCVINSEGRCVRETRPYVVLSCTITVEKDGLQQTAYEAVGGVGGLEKAWPYAEALIDMVGRRAHLKLAAGPAPVGPMPVVLSSSAGGTLIHEAIGHSLEADAVLEGSSPSYAHKVGKVVGVPFLNVVDDPTIAGARGSFYFDDEGTASERTLLVENGVLKTYLYDRLSAARAGVASNGHGRRESFAHRPIPRMSNTCVLPGAGDASRILESLHTGFLVTKMGGGQVNTVNGDFVFEVEEGFRVEDGKARLVRGATLLGNGPDVLFSIEQIGSDWGWGIGTCGKEGQGVPVGDAIPTMKIKSLVIGGGV